MINGTFYLQLFEDIVDILDPEMNLDPDEDFSDQLDEEEEEEEEMDEGQGSPKEKDEDVVKSEGGQSQRWDVNTVNRIWSEVKYHIECGLKKKKLNYYIYGINMCLEVHI